MIISSYIVHTHAHIYIYIACTLYKHCIIYIPMCVSSPTVQQLEGSIPMLDIDLFVK